MDSFQPMSKQDAQSALKKHPDFQPLGTVYGHLYTGHCNISDRLNDAASLVMWSVDLKCFFHGDIIFDYVARDAS